MSNDSADPDYTMIGLKDLNNLMTRDGLQDLISKFNCSKNLDMETFLKKKAIMMDKKDLSRTYLVLDLDNSRILGYFSLGMKCLRVPDDAPISNSARARMNVDNDTSISQSYLLGQLCRDDHSMKGLGRRMMNDALKILKTANEMIGCRLVRIDCDDKLVKYYEENGFKYVSKNEIRNLNQMVIFI